MNLHMLLISGKEKITSKFSLSFSRKSKASASEFVESLVEKMGHGLCPQNVVTVTDQSYF